ncbi:hypothetical protein KBY58_04685 [Cyanobium sp. HWJ4-Hawea]|uniref:hypothetical protein n=1 Tax=Cyanobium sp. HWJ4-Hawea TaxID=2823713 RepID=UPI0020CE8E43|nr:hypothetical protein [Cyanobium sp. HWJ4-Hawea]MCP9808726.1 hypothetical protein [Cyanobium sp. HWJ4-Hawea]
MNSIHPIQRLFRLALASALGSGMAICASPLAGHAEVLYTLQTKCSIKGGSPLPCTVTAENRGNATFYLHQIGATRKTIRITDKPLRMTRWVTGKEWWESLQGAAARFSTDTICFNGRDLCVVNPNYLRSVQINNISTQNRDLVKVHFGSDGRINASCYDDGCGVNLK